jgi:isoquinoline 1-oxidoreductase alpha subunit
MTRLRVNGERRSVHDADMPLVWALRDELGLTGTKYGCDSGACGACTVLLDGKAVRACRITVKAARQADITTIEGVRGATAAAVIAAWQALDVTQCGYCQSGQIMQAIAFLAAMRDPSDAEIDNAMAGILCRCCTYMRIRAAVRRAANELKA